MDQEQRSQRHAAAEAFFDSLCQLEETLQVSDSGSPQSPSHSDHANPNHPQPRKKPSFTLAELEEAAADIEEYFQSLQVESTQPKD